MQQNTLYILLVEKKPILRKRFFKRLKHNDEARFQLWQWVTQNHNIQRHFECFMHTGKELHQQYLLKYQSHYCYEFAIHDTKENRSLVEILFDTFLVAKEYGLERVYFAWLSSILHRIIFDQRFSKMVTYQLHHPLEYVSRSIVSYPLFCHILFRTQDTDSIVYNYPTILRKIAFSLYYIVGEVMGYHIRYPQQLKPAFYNN